MFQYLGTKLYGFGEAIDFLFNFQEEIEVEQFHKTICSQCRKNVFCNDSCKFTKECESRKLGIWSNKRTTTRITNGEAIGAKIVHARKYTRTSSLSLKKLKTEVTRITYSAEDLNSSISDKLIELSEAAEVALESGKINYTIGYLKEIVVIAKANHELTEVRIHLHKAFDALMAYKEEIKK